MLAEEIVILDARAVRASVGVVSQVSVADLARPTPCADWRLAELLAHMTAQHNGFAAAAAGDGGNLVHWQTGAPVADPVGEYAAAAERVIAAFAAAVAPGRGIRGPREQAGAAVPGRRGDRVPLRRLRGARLGCRTDAGPGVRPRTRRARGGRGNRPGSAGRGATAAARGSVRASGRRNARRLAGPDCRLARP